MPFPVDEAHLQTAERELGRTFPEPLRTRLLRRNGGEIYEADDPDEDCVWWLHPVFDTSSHERIRRTANHVVRETQSAREWSGFPPEAIAIGEDGNGNHLVLLPGSDEIYRWDHEEGTCVPVTLRYGE